MAVKALTTNAIPRAGLVHPAGGLDSRAARDSSPPPSGWTSGTNRASSLLHWRRTNAAKCAGSRAPHALPLVLRHFHHHAVGEARPIEQGVKMRRSPWNRYTSSPLVLGLQSSRSSLPMARQLPAADRRERCERGWIFGKVGRASARLWAEVAQPATAARPERGWGAGPAPDARDLGVDLAAIESVLDLLALGRGKRWVVEYAGPVLDELDAAVAGSAIDHVDRDVSSNRG